MNQDFRIGPDDPARSDVRRLLTVHLAFANRHSPPEDVHALDVGGLKAPSISFVSCRRDGLLLGVGAIKRLDEEHAEIKSMHVAQEARGLGIGRAIVAHLMAHAHHERLTRVSLETGSMEAFAPARALYVSMGFTECGPFGDYAPSEFSTFLSRSV